jgi:hypothetical protein
VGCGLWKGVVVVVALWQFYGNGLEYGVGR